MSCRIIALTMIAAFAAIPAPTADAQDASGDVRLHTSSSGVGRLETGKWGLRGVEISNAGDSPVELQPVVTFEGDPLMRFVRRTWVPSQSRRRIVIPIQPAPSDTNEIRTRTTLQEGAGSSPLDGANSGAESMPRVQHPFTVFISDRLEDATDNSPLAKAREMVVALRLASNSTRNLTELTAADVPATPLGLEAVDEIVLRSDEIADEPAALAAIRDWVHSGGRLWIPLDGVSPITIERLFGHAVDVQVIDRVRVEDVKFFNRVKNQPSGTDRVLERPVEFVRVLAPDVDVIHELNGWPASFVQSFGDGLVLFTTLSPDAWMRPRLPREQVANLERNSLYVAETALDELATLMARPLDPPPLASEDFTEYLLGDVGRRVPGRAVIASVLGAFWLAWLAIGYRLLRTSRLERLAVIGPALAVMAAAPLAVLGIQLRNATPPVAALAEFVRVESAGTAAHSQGAASIFVPEPTDVAVTGTGGRLLVPQRDRLDGSARELLWTDFEAWRWNELTIPSGMQTARTERHFRLFSPISATATFGSGGLEGRFDPGPYREPADGLIATAAPQSLAVRWAPNGAFAAGSGELLDQGVFLEGTLLTDVQRRRSAVLQTLLLSPRQSRFPQTPTLLVWANTDDIGVTFPEGMQQPASALLSVPLQLIRPPAGTQVLIPAPFLEYEVTAADGSPSTLYDSRTGLWQKASKSADVRIRFRAPECVLPLSLREALLTIRMRAPLRTVELADMASTEPALLDTLENASGSYEVHFPDSDSRLIDESGLLLRLQVGDLQLESGSPTEPESIDQSWQLESLSLTVTGVTGAPPNDDPSQAEQ